MELVRKVIGNNSVYANLAYYEIVLDKIEKNINSNPDIAIESCKSLIEGLSKFFLKELDNAYDSNKIDKMDFSPLFNKSLDCICNNSDAIESDFLSRLKPLIHYIGEIRNKRGDISHGRLSPKEKESSLHFARFISSITEGIVVYLLENFLLIDFSYKDEVNYDDNKDFNQMMDDSNPMPLISLSYSKALFDQEKETYLILLDDYNVENDIENELKPIKVV